MSQSTMRPARATWVRMKPLSEWPEDHRMALFSQLHARGVSTTDINAVLEVEIECQPRDEQAEFAGRCGLPIFLITRGRDKDGKVWQAYPNSVVCGHIAEID